MNLKRSEVVILSERYANALYSSGLSAGNVEAVCNQFIDISEVIPNVPELASNFKKTGIPEKTLRIMLEVISEKYKFDAAVKNFFLVLNENKRLFLIEEISLKLKELLRRHNNIMIAEVYSSKALAESTLKKVAESLKGSFNKDMEIEQVIDKSILGGLKIKVGSLLFDDSLFSKLKMLKLQFENN